MTNAPFILSYYKRIIFFLACIFLTVTVNAQKKKIPLKFLENILLELKKAGILESKKGKGGGYFFGKDPGQVTLATVMRLIDGPISLLPCVSLYFYEKCYNCDEKHCGLHEVLIQVRDANLKLLEKKTIADLSSKPKSQNVKPKTY